jgi:hypothetical protein
VFRALAFAALLFVGGCYPTTVHPTRVDPTFRLGAALAVSVIYDSSDGSPDAERVSIPSLDLEASLGIRDRSLREPGIGLRFSGTVGISGFGGSAYAEVPRAWGGDVDAGVGIQLHRGSVHLFMPYAQFGTQGTESSWFLRNGVAWVTPRDSTRWQPVWVPTVGFYQHRQGGSNRGLFLTAVIGNQPLVKRDCFLFECFDGGSAYTRTILIFGATTSFVVDGPTPRRYR